MRGLQRTIPKRKSVSVDFSDYEPQEYQKRLHRMCEDRRFVLFCAGIRAGKTFCGARQMRRNIYLWKPKIPLHWLLVPTYKQGEQPCEELENSLQGCILKTRGKPGRPMTFFLRPPLNAPYPWVVLDVRSAENPSTLRGPKVASIWMDEPRDIQRQAWLIAKGRVADEGGRILCTTTSRGKYHWTYEDMYVPATTGNPHFGYVGASTYENKYLAPEVIKELEESYPGDFGRQELYGEFISLAGLVYKDFDREAHLFPGNFRLPTAAECEMVGEPAPKVFCAIDFGYADPFVCLWLADWRGEYWVLDEYYMPGKIVREHAAYIRNHPLAARVEAYYTDPNDLKSRMELAAEITGKVMPAPRDGSGHDTNFQAGVRLIARLLIDRKVKLLPSCVNLVREFGLYHFSDKPDKNKGEKPVDMHNHALDALRYGMRAWTTYRHDASKTATTDSYPGWRPGLQLVRRVDEIVPDDVEKLYPAWYLEGE